MRSATATGIVGLTVGFLIVATGGVAFADQSVGGTDDKGGSVSGVISFEGVKKARPVLVMAADPYCVKANPGPVLSERWVFGADDGLANVLIHVIKGPAIDGKKFTPPKAPHMVDQVNCMYIPHVSAAVAGQKVQFKNSDTTLHNVNILAKINPPENFGQPLKDMVSDTKLTKPEDAVFVRCDVHGWMNCYVHVLTHPYFAVTDRDGKFKIQGLAAGEYELKVWHEVKAFEPKRGSTLKVTIEDGKTATFNLTMMPKKAE
jgi:plastocyanin